MRRNQYSSEKRRKELDRKKKQEEKRQKKLDRRSQGPEEGGVVLDANGVPVAGPEGAASDQAPGTTDTPEAGPGKEDAPGGQDPSPR
jgi:hypothetical protein